MTDTTQVRAAVYGRQSRGKAKSIGEQLAAGDAVIAEEGWEHAGSYQDGTSASRSARTVRDDWQRVLVDIAAKAFTVLILWESSRGDRTPETWFAFLSLCRAQGVRIHVVSHERTYDLSRARDWKVLADDGVSSAYETELLSVRVRRGHAGSAAAGRPSHGRTPYGYVRTYDPATGELAGQEIHPETAPVVREIIGQVAKNVPISTITKSLNARNLPRPGNADVWYRERVLAIAKNPAYAGVRVYNSQQFPGDWPPLVDPAVFWEAQRVLSDPARQMTRPGRWKHLLSYFGSCGTCDARLTAVRGRYKCLDKGCVTILQAPTDDLVTQLILARVSRPDVYAALRRTGVEADREVLAAQNEVAKLTAELNGWRLSGARNETSPASLAVIEADLSARIRSAQRRGDHAAVPPALRQILEPGADVRVRWDAASLPARRELIRTFMSIRILPAAVPGSRNFEPQRVDVEWL